MNEELMEGHSFKEIDYVPVRTAKELPTLPSSVIEALTWTCVPQKARVPSLPSFQCEALVSPSEGQDGSGSHLHKPLHADLFQAGMAKKTGSFFPHQAPNCQAETLPQVQQAKKTGLKHRCLAALTGQRFQP